jgi:hypothetical protein
MDLSRPACRPEVQVLRLDVRGGRLTKSPILSKREIKHLKACPACGSPRLAPTTSRASRIATAVVFQLVQFDAGKKCLDCGWQVG